VLRCGHDGLGRSGKLIQISKLAVHNPGVRLRSDVPLSVALPTDSSRLPIPYRLLEVCGLALQLASGSSGACTKWSIEDLKAGQRVRADRNQQCLQHAL
jgi:hypothetical protein